MRIRICCTAMLVAAAALAAVAIPQPVAAQATRAVQPSAVAPVATTVRAERTISATPGTSRSGNGPAAPLATLLIFGIGMTALAADRDTRRKDGRLFSYPVAAAKKIFKGALVVMDSGYANPGATALGLVAVGRAEETIDNSAGGAGDLRVTVERGVFSFGNSAAGDAIALGDVGAKCYIVDDQTVAKTDGGGTRSVAGIISDVDAAGVWVVLTLLTA